jgi:hypothetical protein
MPITVSPLEIYEHSSLAYQVPGCERLISMHLPCQEHQNERDHTTVIALALIREVIPHKSRNPQCNGSPRKIGSVCMRKLTNVIERAAIENRNSRSVGNSLQSQLTSGIKSERKGQTARFTEPEKHRAASRFCDACVRCEVGRPGIHHQFECE